MKISTSGTSGGNHRGKPRQSSSQQVPQILNEHDDEDKFAGWITCPLTGEMAAPHNVDRLAAMYQRLEACNKAVYAAMCDIRRAMADMTEGDAATRRIRGKNCQVKVTMPAVKFEQSVLKALWESHPDLAHEFMKIETVGVKLREFAKLENMAGSDPAFVYFRDTLTNACRGRDGLPSVAIEERK